MIEFAALIHDAEKRLRSGNSMLHEAPSSEHRFFVVTQNTTAAEFEAELAKGVAPNSCGYCRFERTCGNSHLATLGKRTAFSYGPCVLGRRSNGRLFFEQHGEIPASATYFPQSRIVLTALEKTAMDTKKPAQHPGHCECCDEPKWNTGPRERTCGKDECVKAVYGN